MAFTINGFGIALQVDSFSHSNAFTTHLISCRMLKPMAWLQASDIKLRRRWASCMLSMVIPLPCSSGVNLIIHNARSWCFHLTYRCHSVHSAPALVIPLYCLARNRRFQHSHPLPHLRKQNSWRCVNPSISLVHASLLSWERVFTSHRSRNGGEGSRRTQLVQPDPSYQSCPFSCILYPCLCWGGSDHWWYVEPTFVPYLRGWFVESRLDRHIHAWCPWRRSFCRLYFVGLFRRCMLDSLTANTTNIT